MKTQLALYAAFLPVLLSACATKPRWLVQEIAPTKGGVVVYYDSSVLPQVNEANREAALSEAKDYCGGAIKIGGEQTLAGPRETTERHVRFICRG